MKAIKTFLIMLFCLGISNVVFAGHSGKSVNKPHVAKKSAKKHSYGSFTLFDYIHANCKQTCVDHQSLADSTREAAAKFHLSQRILIALIKVESNFNRLARNGKNGVSIGLTQVQLYWHRDKFRGKSYTDTHANVMAGAQILGSCMEKGRSAAKALVCYNGGGDGSYVAKVNKSLKEVSRLVDVES